MSDFKRDAYGTPLVADLTKRKADGTPAMVRYSRPSSYVKQIENTYNLSKWSERTVVRGIAIGLGDLLGRDEINDLLASALAGDDQAADTVVARAKQHAQASLAADRGTWVHEFTQWLDGPRPSAIGPTLRNDGITLGIDVDAQDLLAGGWRLLLEQHQLTVIDVELPVVNDEFRTAGTLDRIVRLDADLAFRTEDGEIVTLPAGSHMVLDLKTGERKSFSYWNGYAGQIYLYASSLRYDTTTNTRHPHGFAVDQRWGLLAHLDVKAAIAGDSVADLYLVDLNAGRNACEIAAAAKTWASTTGVFGVVHEIAVPVTAPPQAVEQQPTGERSPSSDRPGGHLSPAQQKSCIPSVDDGPDTRRAADWVDLQGRFERLHATGKDFLKQLMRESMAAGVSWHKKERTSDRRWTLYHAALTLAEQRLELDCSMEAMRALIAHVVDADWPLYPVITVGHAFGSLTATEASRLVDAINDFDDGKFHADLTRDIVELRRVA